MEICDALYFLSICSKNRKEKLQPDNIEKWAKEKILKLAAFQLCHELLVAAKTKQNIIFKSKRDYEVLWILEKYS